MRLFRLVSSLRFPSPYALPFPSALVLSLKQQPGASERARLSKRGFSSRAFLPANAPHFEPSSHRDQWSRPLVHRKRRESPLCPSYLPHSVKY
ncbi:hypothetical protein CEXT_452621 [Caerostris extrusa]|uniref:Secreted protein n=1 Tax=Caerostris extrusa TaxID=172846 RepID=A0AAV4PJM6_CAEEX|nr:hypothetical protein CEXT_452621 [Caerostris extrusa]